MLTLIMKELSERKTIIIFAVIAALIPQLFHWFCILTNNWSFRCFTFPIFFLGFLFVLMVYPVIIAESSFSGESEKKTLHFLLSMPISRSTIWFAKFLSGFIILLFIESLFIIINYSLIHPLLKTSATIQSLSIIFIFCISITFLLHIITFFSSTISNRSMTSSITSLLLFLISLILLTIALNLTGWSLSLNNIIIIIAAFCLFYTLSSFIIFVKIYQNNVINIIKTVAICLLLSVLLSFLLISADILPEKACGIEGITPEPDSGRLLANVSYEGIENNRLWLIDPQQNKTTKFKESPVFAAMFIKKGLIQYDKLNMLDAFSRGNLNLQHRLKDVSSSKATDMILPYTTRTDWNSLGNFYAKSYISGNNKDERELILIIPRREGHLVNIDITVLSGKGHVVKDFRLPKRIDVNTSIDENNRLKEKTLKFFFLGKQKFSFFIPVKKYDMDYLSIIEIDVRTGQMNDKLELPLSQNNSIYRSFELSPDGRFIASVSEAENHDCAILLLQYDKSSGNNIKWNQLFYEINATIKRLAWLQDSKRLTAIIDENGKKEKIIILNVKEKKCDVIFQSSYINSYKISPGGDKIAFIARSPETKQNDSLSLYFKELNSEKPPVLVSSNIFPVSGKWDFQWKNNDMLLYNIWPWDIYSATINEKAPVLRKIFP